MTPRIFIVDDEQDLLLIYQLILEPEGYDVRLTSSRLQLQQMMDVEPFPPNLIIVDYHLGKYDQHEPLWQQLKADPTTSTLPLILCTADANALRGQEDFLKETGVHVVLKPFNIHVLLQTIRQALVL